MESNEQFNVVKPECNDHKERSYEINSLKETTKAILEDIAEIRKDTTSLSKELTIAHESAKSAHHRLNELSQILEALQGIVSRVEVLSERVVRMVTDNESKNVAHEEIIKRLEALEQQSSKRALSFVKYAAIIVSTAILSKFGDTIFPFLSGIFK